MMMNDELCFYFYGGSYQAATKPQMLHSPQIHVYCVLNSVQIIARLSVLYNHKMCASSLRCHTHTRKQKQQESTMQNIADIHGSDK